jgi:hypothetical protein
VTLRRWIEEEPSSVQARLLRAGQRVEPPASAYEKTIVGLGLGAGTLVSAQVASASSANASLIGAKVAFGATLGGVVVKGIAVGVLVGTAVLGAVQASHSLKAPPRGRSVPSQAPALAASQAKAEPHVRPGTTPLEQNLQASTPQLPSEPASHAPTPLAQVERVKPTDHGPADELARPAALGASLGAEVALIDRVRQSLNQGQPARALALLDQHRRDFASPRLREESCFLRARALEQLGQRAEATRVMEQFRRDYPNSTLGEER